MIKFPAVTGIIRPGFSLFKCLQNIIKQLGRDEQHAELSDWSSWSIQNIPESKK
jgi:hypothetical protein